jgi:flagellar assembly factor FliW
MAHDMQMPHGDVAVTPLTDAATSDLPNHITFPEGLVGCPTWQHFLLLPNPFEGCGELTCLDDEGITLLVADPAWLGIPYQLEIDGDDADALHLMREDDARILCVLTIHHAVPMISANLAGPLIINRSERLGRQVILDHHAYPLRAPVIGGEAARQVIDALAGAGTADAAAAPQIHPSALQPKKGA